MSRNATGDMEPQPRSESAKAPSSSVLRLGHDRPEVTAPGTQQCLEQAHSSATSHSSFQTDALRQAEIRAKAHLRKRRLRGASVTLAGESEPLKGKGNHLYFLSDGDVKDIVGIVMDAVRRGLTAPARGPKTPHGSEANANFDDAVAPGGFAYGRNSITPRLSVAADPATTFSMPKTVFSYTNWEGDRRVSVAESRLDSSTKTTIVSRGSVSEIIWTERHQSSDGTGIRDSLSSAGNFHDAISQHCLRCHSLSKCGRCQNMIEAEREASLCRFASLVPMSMNKRANRSTDEESNMTSFPELRPRNCTNDWLKPPVEIEQLLQDKSSDLYRRGVDAHSGQVPNSPQSTTRMSPVSLSIPYNDGVFNNIKNSFFSTTPCFQERRVTESSIGDGKKQSTNTISSVSYYHRASSQIPAANQSPWQSDGELLPQIVDKLRQNSQDSVPGENLYLARAGAWPSESEMLLPSDQSRAVFTRSRDSIIRERTLKPPAADKLGIYEALTGSRMTSPKKRCVNCSEDNRPHICEDDLESRTSMGP
ncbi:hypothetical protein E4U21_002603 [Claviceps maximensis]|nr:hypothetical protein E4U21_002603 [Claviceps maximensis]